MIPSPARRFGRVQFAALLGWGHTVDRLPEVILTADARFTRAAGKHGNARCGRIAVKEDRIRMTPWEAVLSRR